VLNFAKKAKVLHDLTAGTVMGSWTPECQKAFDKLKTALTTAPILRYPDFSSPFRLATDASDDGLGAVLTQLDDKKVEHVIGYASRALNNAECHYSVTERECLGVVWAVKHYHFYLVGTHFTPLTDHSALKWLIALKDPNGKFARWVLSIQEYDCTALADNTKTLTPCRAILWSRKL